MYTIFRALLLAAHLFYALFVAIRNFAKIAHRKCIELFCGDNTRTELEILVRAADNMKKLPQHLVIVFGRKEDTVLDCVRIIGWCVTLGIPYISFFDSSGVLRKNERNLKDEVAKRSPDIAGYITWGKPRATPLKNGFIGSKPKTHVWLLSYADGKGEIVSLTKELASAVVTGSIKVEEINDDLLNEKLSLRGIPDPDLALIDGHVCSTYGLLPWHTRTTEFLMLPPHGCLSATDFLNLLEKYNGILQQKKSGKSDFGKTEPSFSKRTVSKFNLSPAEERDDTKHKGGPPRCRTDVQERFKRLCDIERFTRQRSCGL